MFTYKHPHVIIGIYDTVSAKGENAMHYVIKNLSGFVKHYTGIFVLIVVCQIVCILLSFFSFGVYQNFRNEANRAAEGEPAEFEGFHDITPQAELPEKYKLSVDKYDSLYKELGETLGDKMYVVFTENENFAFSMVYESGNIIFIDELQKNLQANKMWDYGRSFTKAEYIDGARVCIAPSGCCEEFADEERGQVPSEYPYPAYKKGDTWYVDIEGIEYECIGFHQSTDIYYIPYKNIPENITITDFPHVALTSQLTADEFEKAVKVYEKYFPGVDFQFVPLTLIDNEELYYYNTNMWISVLIAVISAINLALIMNYILTRRRKSLAIFRITGCSANRARQIYVMEIMLVLNMLFIICLAVWILWILPILSEVFAYIEGAFSPRIYLYIYLLYMVISYVIMNIMTIRYIRRSPVELLKTR